MIFERDGRNRMRLIGSLPGCIDQGRFDGIGLITADITFRQNAEGSLLFPRLYSQREGTIVSREDLIADLYAQACAVAAFQLDFDLLPSLAGGLRLVHRIHAP